MFYNDDLDVYYMIKHSYSHRKHIKTKLLKMKDEMIKGCEKSVNNPYEMN